MEIYIELPVKEHLCPYCGAETTKIHDYRTQIITDIPVYFKNTKLIYNKRRNLREILDIINIKLH